MKKMWYTDTVEYHSAIKNKDIMNFVGKVENIILGEVTQTQRERHGVYSLISG